MLYLKEAGFKHLGHVHCGNIFIVNGECRVGGHENTLLGYRTSIYNDMESTSHFNSMDVVMFGKCNSVGNVATPYPKYDCDIFSRCYCSFLLFYLFICLFVCLKQVCAQCNAKCSQCS